MCATKILYKHNQTVLKTLISVAIALCATNLFLLWCVPFGSAWIEILVGLTTAIALIPVLHFAEIKSRQGKRITFGNILVIPFFVLPVFLFAGRVETSVAMSQAFDGPIISKYSSTNHGIPSIVVMSHQQPVVLEGVNQSVWQTANIGDHIVKLSGTTYCTIQGNKMKFVPHLAFFDMATRDK